MSNAHRSFALAASVTLLACASPEDKAREAEAARQAAVKQVAQIEEATEVRETDIQRKASVDISEVVSEGDRKIAKVASEADRKENDATQALWVAREDAGADASRQLDRIDRELAALRPDLEVRVTGAQATVVLDELRARATGLRARIEELRASSAEDFRATKQSVQTGLDDLGRAVADARNGRASEVLDRGSRP